MTLIHQYWIIGLLQTLVSPGKSIQFVIGYEEYIRNTYKVQIEGYYKDLKKSIDL